MHKGRTLPSAVFNMLLEKVGIEGALCYEAECGSQEKSYKVISLLNDLECPKGSASRTRGFLKMAEVVVLSIR